MRVGKEMKRLLRLTAENEYESVDDLLDEFNTSSERRRQFYRICDLLDEELILQTDESLELSEKANEKLATQES